ncbi:hypothetical protein PZN02_006327 (plasmid) [Sinorhizobium garamanticum]|uniref:Uncharacterized protein n=1 Tax=Sinorhizobium garamanticum TaxID=680247 RepID=A0ABY8DKS6_9HYPH|nr:hypothetical protein PZN02_006327 [Sinorhizobium garamanticum]
MREFDVAKGEFVKEGFVLPEGKQSVTWVDENTMYVTQIRGLEVIVSPSGTDAHMLASKLVAGSSPAKTLAIMVQSEETGSGVGHALAMHSPHRESGGTAVNPADPIDVRSIAVRMECSSLRPMAAVDDELEAIVSAAITRYSRILKRVPGAGHYSAPAHERRVLWPGLLRRSRSG